MKIRHYLISSVFTCIAMSTSLISAEEKATKEIYISPGVLSVDVKNNDKAVKLMRNQTPKNEIVAFYRRTERGKIQPMHPFKPHHVETIGELGMIDYIKRKSDGDDNLMIIDSRTSDWVKRSGKIPGAVNIPFTKFADTESTMEIMEDNFDVLVGETYDFSNAKTLIMYCNGTWCAQSPTAIKKLLRMGYPAAKIKYYRGGMQSWASLGLTVVKP